MPPPANLNLCIINELMLIAHVDETIDPWCAGCRLPGLWWWWFQSILGSDELTKETHLNLHKIAVSRSFSLMKIELALF